MFARAEDKTEILPAYQDIVRNSTSCPDECLRKITMPLAKLFVSVEDYRSANKVVVDVRKRLARRTVENEG